MVYDIENVMRDVRVAMDENKVNDQLIAEEDIDTLMLDDIIRSKIEESVRLVVSVAPFHLLDGGLPFGDAVFWRNDNSGWILLPDDFLRLVVFRMSDWERPVFEAITAADAQYQQQFSRYRGLRGNPQKPVVAIVMRQEGKALELYSCNSQDATVDQATYIPVPKIDAFGGINIPEQCYKSVVYEIASLVCIALEKQEMAQLFQQLSKELLS